MQCYPKLDARELLTIAVPGMAAALLCASTALGHHSVAAIFDVDSIVETQGEVVSVSWRNPHARFEVEATGADGSAETWTIELTSLTNLRRDGLVGQLVSVGDNVRVAGSPDRRGANSIYARNLLVNAGDEILLEPRSQPRWGAETRERELLTGPGDGSRPDLGIFRVWSSPRNEPLLLPEDTAPVFPYDMYPLTDAARATVEAFDRITDSPILNCVPKGMPTIMEQPYPMAFERDGDDILLLTEEYDVVRTIHMDPDATFEGQPLSKYGYSIGRWEGNTLIVHTRRSNWEYFDVVGIPLSVDSDMLERFTLSEDGSRLDYSLTVTDPATFTEPVTVGKYWAWYPGMTIEPYECLVR